MTNATGKFLGVGIALMLLLLMYSNVIVSESMLDRRQIASEMVTFMDSVIDSREITESSLNQFVSSITSHGAVVNYKITRKIRNVTYQNVGGVPTAITTYVTDPNENPMKFEKGDHIVLRVYEESFSSTQYIVRELTQMFMKDFDYTLEMRVR